MRTRRACTAGTARPVAEPAESGAGAPPDPLATGAPTSSKTTAGEAPAPSWTVDREPTVAVRERKRARVYGGGVSEGEKTYALFMRGGGVGGFPFEDYFVFLTSTTRVGWVRGQMKVLSI